LAAPEECAALSVAYWSLCPSCETCCSAPNICSSLPSWLDRQRTVPFLKERATDGLGAVAKRRVAHRSGLWPQRTNVWRRITSLGTGATPLRSRQSRRAEMPPSQHQAMIGESDMKGRARHRPTSRRHVVCSAGWRMGPHSTGKDHSRSRAGRSSLSVHAGDQIRTGTVSAQRDRLLRSSVGAAVMTGNVIQFPPDGSCGIVGKR
jgi:hypothetical protein